MTLKNWQDVVDIKLSISQLLKLKVTDVNFFIKVEKTTKKWQLSKMALFQKFNKFEKII